jgi:hypothetical protein
MPGLFLLSLPFDLHPFLQKMVIGWNFESQGTILSTYLTFSLWLVLSDQEFIMKKQGTGKNGERGNHFQLAVSMFRSSKLF